MPQTPHTNMVTKTIDFCYGHRLLGYDGKCRFLHGHNGRAEIDVYSQSLDQRGMVMDFADVKAIAKQWIDDNLDQRMILHRADPVARCLQYLGEPVFLVETNPTSEAIAQVILNNVISLGLDVHAVRLWETPSSVAAVFNCASGHVDAPQRR